MSLNLKVVIMKKAIICLVLSTGILGFLLSSCCRNVLGYWAINDFKIEIVDEDQNPPLNNQITTNTLFLNLVLDTDFVAEATFNPFGNACYATQRCPYEGELGLKDRLKNIIVSSNMDFNNYPAGTALDSLVLVGGDSLASWIDMLKLEPYEFYTPGHIPLQLTERPTNNLMHVFTISIEQASGRVLTMESDTITWN
jgi:hypothetical protein